VWLPIRKGPAAIAFVEIRRAGIPANPRGLTFVTAFVEQGKGRGAAKCRRAWSRKSALILGYIRIQCAVAGDMSFYEQLKFNSDGLIPAIVQEQSTRRVLMMAWMNRASIEKTIATGKTHFWSRSRQKFWMKGETSGHVQTVKDIAFDCDGDTLLIQVEQIGAACHEGYQSCFFRSVSQGSAEPVVTEKRLENPDDIYGQKQK